MRSDMSACTCCGCFIEIQSGNRFFLRSRSKQNMRPQSIHLTWCNFRIVIKWFASIELRLTNAEKHSFALMEFFFIYSTFNIGCCCYFIWMVKNAWRKWISKISFGISRSSINAHFKSMSSTLNWFAMCAFSF